MKKSNKKRAPILFYLGLIICLLTVFTSSLSSSMSAKFATGDDASDSARVAKFKIDDGFLDGNYLITIADMLPGEQRIIQFEIDNQSEVAVNFLTETLKVTNNLPITFTEIDLDIPAKTKYTVSYYVNWEIKTDDGISTDSKEFSDKVELVEIKVSASQID